MIREAAGWVVAVAMIYPAFVFHNGAASADRFQEAVVRRDAGLPIRGDLDRQKAVDALQDWVYRGFRVAAADALPDAEPAIRYAALGSAYSTLLCGGAAETLVWALEAIHLPARFVQLASARYLAGADQGDTHAAVEVLVKGRWVYSDPTYNVAVRCKADGPRLSVVGIRACLDDGKTPILEHGPSFRSDRPVPSDYFHYFAAYEIRSGDAVVEDFPRSGWVEQTATLYSN